MFKTAQIIHQEHQALAAVLQTMRLLMRSIVEGRNAPDFILFATMLDYIAQMPEKLHHPKEELYLHRRLRERAPQAAPVLDQLVAEHRDSPHAVERMSRALVHYMAVGDAGAKEFLEQVEAYVHANWEHMNLEESRVMPLAKTALTEQDWAEIDAEFSANADPYKGPSGEYDAMFSRIVQLAPAPYGLGDAR